MNEKSFESQLMDSFNKKENENKNDLVREMEEKELKRIKKVEASWRQKYNSSWRKKKKNRDKIARASRKANR